MRARICKYERIGVRQKLYKYIFITELYTDTSGNFNIIELIHYGADRNSCLCAAVRQLDSMGVASISLSKLGLWSGVSSARAKLLGGDKYSVEVQYICNEDSDNFTMIYPCQHGTKPDIWLSIFLRHTNLAGEYYRYIGENPQAGYGDVDRCL